jgi:hypothetical protein
MGIAFGASSQTPVTPTPSAYEKVSGSCASACSQPEEGRLHAGDIFNASSEIGDD